MRRLLVAVVRPRCVRLVAAAALLLVMGTSVQACPMCAESIAAENDLPRAYMYSILFMLTVPAMVFTGFGVAITRAIKKHDAQ